MAHENDEERDGCEFSTFFATTPGGLVSDGLYKALAMACYPGEHRAASMALLALALGAVPVRGAGSLEQIAGSLSDVSTSTVSASANNVVSAAKRTNSFLASRFSIKRSLKLVAASSVQPCESSSV